jgi:hypothetical protein
LQDERLMALLKMGRFATIRELASFAVLRPVVEKYLLEIETPAAKSWRFEMKTY